MQIDVAAWGFIGADYINKELEDKAIMNVISHGSKNRGFFQKAKSPVVFFTD